jgi:hypothetical protein
VKILFEFENVTNFSTNAILSTARRFPMTTASQGVELDHETPNAATGSKVAVWTGRVISTLVVLFMLFDGGVKVVQIEAVMKMSREMGFSDGTIFGIGIACLISAVFYAIPQTAILGAILLTGYLGGAIAVNVFLKQPLFNWIFAFTFGVLTWLGVYLREPRLRSILFCR